MSTIIPETSVHYDEARIIEHPDGFYWQDRETEAMYGPFPSLSDAVENMDYNDESDYEPGETLEEAEAELGISDWIDHETGLPGEESHRLED